MRRTKRAAHKRTRTEPKYQSVASAGLKAAGRSAGEFNHGFQEITDVMNEYSLQSLENAFRAWQQFLDARPLRQAVELQTRYAQTAYEAYLTEVSRLEDLHLNLTRRFSKPLGQMSRRSQRASA
jgi:hypothetical protein